MRLKMTGRRSSKSGGLEGYRVRIPPHLKHLVEKFPPKFDFPAKYGEKRRTPKIKNPKLEFTFSLGTRNIILYEERLMLARQQFLEWKAQLESGVEALQPYQISAMAREIFEFYGVVVSDPRWRVDSISTLHSFHRRMYDVTQGSNIDSRDEYHEFRGVLPFAETESFNQFFDRICEFSEKEMDPLYKLPEYDKNDPSKEAVIYRTAAITRWWLALKEYSPSNEDIWAIMLELDRIISITRYLGFGSANTVSSDSADSPVLSTLSNGSILEMYAKWETERNPSKNTRKSYSKHLRDFNAFVEGKDVSKITRLDVVRWKDSLLSPGGTVTVETVRDNHLKALSSVLSYAERNTYIKENPIKEPIIKLSKMIGKRVKPYKDAEVGIILKAALEFDKTHRHRWIAWLLATTGARVGEITQLLPSQIYNENGVWMIDIRPSEDEGTVKTDGSIRQVPLHRILIEDGFLEFVSNRGNLPLFYRPRKIEIGGRHPSEGSSETHGNWVRTLKNRGIDFVKKAPNHSFRHWFTTHQAEIGVHSSITARIQGHVINGMQEIYVGRELIKAMSEAVNKINFKDLLSSHDLN